MMLKFNFFLDNDSLYLQFFGAFIMQKSSLIKVRASQKIRA